MKYLHITTIKYFEGKNETYSTVGISSDDAIISRTELKQAIEKQHGDLTYIIISQSLLLNK